MVLRSTRMVDEPVRVARLVAPTCRLARKYGIESARDASQTAAALARLTRIISNCATSAQGPHLSKLKCLDELVQICTVYKLSFLIILSDNDLLPHILPDDASN